MGRSVILSFTVVAALTFSVLILNLVKMQIVQFEYYSDIAERKRLRIEIIDAPRGTIYDRHGTPLAFDRASYDVALILSEFDPTLAIADLLEREVGVRNAIGVLDSTLFLYFLGDRSTEPIDCGYPKNVKRILRLKEKYPVKYGALQLKEDRSGRLRLLLHHGLLYHHLGVLARLASIVGVDFFELLRRVEEIRERVLSIKNAYQRRYEMSHPQTILEDIGRRVAFEIEMEAENLAGIVVVERKRRAYRGKAFAHLIGYLRRLNEEEVKRYGEQGLILSRAYNPLDSFNRVEDAYFIDDEVGATGVEAVCERRLRGRKGAQLLEYDLLTRRYRILQRIEPIAGEDVYLTIDAGLQEKAYQALEEAGIVGAVVLMKPETGEVIAMVSHPSYDPNRIREAGYYRLLLKEPYPLLERASRSAYAPGSTMKIVAAIAGLSEGIIDEKTTFRCRGYHKTPKAFRCWVYPKAHGNQNLSDALAHSCNTFFFNLADGMNSHQLLDWFRRFGIGERPSIETGATAGFLPTPQWKRRRYESLKARLKEIQKEGGVSERRITTLRRRLAIYRDERVWVPGDNRSLVIGQGALLVSPLQVARMVAVVANGGFLVEPKILLDSPVRRKKLPIKGRHLETIKDGMWRVVSEKGGTAYGKGLKRFSACAKTGTAEVNKRRSVNHAWIVGFAPKKRPEVVFVVFGERVKGHGGEVAGPIAAKVLGRFFKDIKVATGDVKTIQKD